ncbi:hypothetical protein NADFUDRAFT_83068 [Nadsonia fulvescens var. elongata DSM 6958]|uniref:Copper transport protein n=1 Tax=Nadsonia fulvescens var. elongata DSM 6958 TaxID=857566 RepID=A0A1E3PI98_9ASCO|nr:hypothetical protein NADFUDRAFT_83068 [Nadsonia fulvescens var. elongata DSM 6958]
MSHSHTADTDMSSMDMDTSTTTSTSSTSMYMTMVFHASINDPVLTTQFTPSTAGQYAGALIFVIVLAIIFRGLFVVSSRLKSYYLRLETTRKVVVANMDYDNGSHSNEEEGSDSSDLEVEDNEGEEEKIVSASDIATVKQSYVRVGARPWRLSVDLPLALVQVSIAGVGYLLMFIVMTMNIGYFVAMLVGIFLGELFLARYGGEAKLISE